MKGEDKLEGKVKFIFWPSFLPAVGQKSHLFQSCVPMCLIMGACREAKRGQRGALSGQLCRPLAREKCSSYNPGLLEASRFLHRHKYLKGKRCFRCHWSNSPLIHEAVVQGGSARKSWRGAEGRAEWERRQETGVSGVERIFKEESFLFLGVGWRK